jgi:hypothetical protein
MQASHDLSRISMSFDEPNVVASAGLVAPGLLLQKVGFADLLEATLSLPRPAGASSGPKAATVLAGMLAGADSIEDLDGLRSGATPQLFDQLRAPSTIGTWLRAFSCGHVRQLDAVTRELRRRLWAAGAGPQDPAGPLVVDVDSTICQTFGLAKSGASFGSTKVRGYHPLLATIAAPGQVGEVLHTRLRRGSAQSGKGGGHFLTEAPGRARSAGASGPLPVRADAGFYSRAFVRACRRAGARFSVTVRSNPTISAAIAAIEDSAWRPIPYWDAVEDDDGVLVASSAEVAETTTTAFAGTPDAVTARLVVRRVRRLRDPDTGGQLHLDTPIWRHHALLTDRDEPLLTVEAEHRGHAVVEQTIAELKANALAHLPSGSFWANAAWLTLAALAHNLGRALATLAGHGLGRATLATLRRTLLAVPGRLVRSARRWHLRLSAGWPWARAFTWLLRRLHALPAQR